MRTTKASFKLPSSDVAPQPVTLLSAKCFCPCPSSWTAYLSRKKPMRCCSRVLVTQLVVRDGRHPDPCRGLGAHYLKQAVANYSYFLYLVSMSKKFTFYEESFLDIKTKRSRSEEKRVSMKKPLLLKVLERLCTANYRATKR